MNFINELLSLNIQELLLASLILIFIVMSVYNNKTLNKFANILSVLAIVFITISLLFVPLSLQGETISGYSDSNLFTVLMKVFVLISSIFIILMSFKFTHKHRTKAFEYYIMLFTGILGAFCLIIANDFVTAFISMEMISLSAYILIAFDKSELSKEASIKYLIQSSLASAFFLFAVSYLYGLTGTFSYAGLNEYFLNNPNSYLYIICGVILLISAMYKMGCIPFTNWIPEVYQGSPYCIGAYLSTIPKIAIIAFIARILVYAFPHIYIIKNILLIISVVSIAVGLIGAIRQTNIKRFFGYSSIAHSGFMLIGLALMSVYSLSCVIFYLFTYIFMNLGIWSAAFVFNSNSGTDYIKDYSALYKTRPYFALAFAVCLISLAGLPITSGFVSKLYLFSSLIKDSADNVSTLLIVLLLTLIGVIAYFNFVKLLFTPAMLKIKHRLKLRYATALLYICSGLTLLISFFPNKLIELAQIVAYYI